MHLKASVLAVTALGLTALVLVSGPRDLRAQPAATGHEYVTIRWDGRDNTHLIRPGGRVEFIGTELRKLPRPDRANERSFYLNAAINGLAREGFEVQAMTPDDVLMRR